MTFDIENHLIQPERFLSSPNHDERPDTSDISLLVIHCISLPPNSFGGDCVENFFCNRLDHSAHPFFEEIKDLKVSAHLFIKRCGSIIQFVPFDKRAWHCGVSEFQGRKVCNDFSIGIELEGTDDSEYTNEQYDVLIEVSKTLKQHYPKITNERIVGHEHIAPKRKTDPGKHFDWQRLLNSV